MKFVSITNKKATSIFHVPVQMPTFPCSQRSQGAVMSQKCRQHKKVCRARGPQTKIITSLYPQRTLRCMTLPFYMQQLSYMRRVEAALRYIRLCCIQQFFCDTKEILAGAKKLLCHIWHSVDPTLLYPASTVHTAICLVKCFQQ